MYENVVAPYYPLNMIHNNTSNLLDHLRFLEDSTTYFLESLKGNTLQVSIESQSEIFQDNCELIKREVKLFFNTAESPILYCNSYLYKNKLTKEEYRLIVEGKLPIGKIFYSLNPSVGITKRALSVSMERGDSLAISLRVKSRGIIKKSYEYWVDSRKIGFIQEFFNEESLKRI